MYKIPIDFCKYYSRFNDFYLSYIFKNKLDKYKFMNIYIPLLLSATLGSISSSGFPTS